MDKFIKDAISFDMKDVTVINEKQAKFCKKAGIPAFKGTLYKVDEYGNHIKVRDNTVVLGGGIFALAKIFGTTPSFIPTTLNSIYNVQASAQTDMKSTFVTLFGLGTGGCGETYGSVVDPDFKQRELIDFIPLQVSSSTTLSVPNSNKYFFKKQLSSGQYGWYLKEFESPVSIKSRWKDSVEEGKDGTEITAEVYNSSRSEQIESYGEAKITIENSDVFSYWDSLGVPKSAKFNTLGLFTGQKVQVSTGVYEYVNVRLFSAITFNNVETTKTSKSSYVYRIYAAI